MAQEILKPLLLDETGKEIVAALNSVAERLATLAGCCDSVDCNSGRTSKTESRSDHLEMSWPQKEGGGN